MPDLQRVAKRTLGFGLRPEQAAAVEAVVSGRDVLVVMPTGAGKSAVYQVAGALVPGPTVVVSPLIALQRDQVEAIEHAEVGDAAALNSSLSAGARDEALDELRDGSLEFLLLAPEQLANEETLEELAAARPSLFVVDEAHCISEWGHDFRPEYLRLGAAAERLGGPTIVALTATASPPVRDEIVERLHMRDPLVLVHGFDRPNLHLAVEEHFDEKAKDEALLEAVVAAPKPGIVYAATRAAAEHVAAGLVARGLTAAPYHAGLAKSERDDAQTRFMDDDLDVVVATTAFGMGVDKANVRFVFHHAIADSVDAYYQEIGRAGRDGAPASARLFYRREDLGLRRFFGGAGAVDAEEVSAVAAAVAAHARPVPAAALQDETGLSQTKLATALARLEDVGAVEILPTGEVASDEPIARDTVTAAVEAQEHRREFDRSRLEMVRAYAEVRDCRRAFVLSYFGEAFEPPCGNCDNCDAGIVATARDEVPFEVGARVRHAAWGDGAVQRYEGDKMVVLFDEVGYRTLAVDLVEEHDLLSELRNA
jgi:ATP-dependent DNA helicase RecQ